MNMALNWRMEWIKPFESPWSIFEKIKYANLVSTKQLIQKYGTDQSRKIKTGKVSKRNRNLVSFAGLDMEQLGDALKVSLLDHVKNHKALIMDKLPDYLKETDLFATELRYCKDCMNQGYHSYFHQLQMVDYCPFHLCKLDEVCFHCELPISFTLPAHEIEHGFIRDCGESLITEVKGYKHFIEDWQQELQVQDVSLTKFLCLDELSEARIKSSYFFLKTRKTLDHIMALTQETNALVSYSHKKHTTQDSNLFEEIYNTSRHVLKSFEIYLERTYLTDHKHCIRRFLGLYKRRGEEFPPICPYAYAYVFWKESFYNINPFFNEIEIKPRHMKSMQFPFSLHSEDIRDLITLVRIKKPREDAYINWLVGHIVWEIAHEHFHEWLKISAKHSSTSMRPMTKFSDFTSRNTIISFVEDSLKSKTELHVSKNISTFKVGQLECPFRDKKYKKINSDEISHLPMRLAINSGFDEDKRNTEKYLAGLKVFSFAK
jgi:hypothetical protein